VEPREHEINEAPALIGTDSSNAPGTLSGGMKDWLTKGESTINTGFNFGSALGEYASQSCSRTLV
jgi:hypothetical protein